MKVRTRIFLVQIAGLVLVSLLLVVAVNRTMRAQALEEARAKARLILDRNLATHTYFTHELRPAVAPIMESVEGPDAFDPVWMSSTYAIRRIQDYFGELNPVPYHFKESALGARNPLNEADAFERAFLDSLNLDPDLSERATVREIDGAAHFQVLRRGETMERSCLRCHSDPEVAPAQMVELYGPERSFEREEGEVVSAISIRIPLDEAFAAADRFSLELSAIILTLLVLLWGGNTLLWSQWVMRPLAAVQRATRRIAASDEHLGETIQEPRGEDLRELVRSFNAMSTSLGKSHAELEGRVSERTRELQEALENVRTLSGLLPICASCKKIRDDQGYWNGLESYISRHSDVLFSHGICPECLEILYPEVEGKEEKP